ncbi:hypothetical protein OG884_12555 [Streptosporangium sp. NBC_01755]|uniref:hypothetical protein n=1 Tax=Streptosporangium sp. NBC_01755 TaxID=2975949 RepID=UPI002DDB5A37|nr:hypothetical protein [Streptosporangium sp. NBC_01755]WSD02688.1 hypothetical protein OG884_12555 [Streptosporangium sp. NBC_01755]
MRPQWDDLPNNVRHTVEQQIGQVLKAEPVTKGLMPGLAARLHTEDGGAVFLKAVSTASPAATLYERERQAGAVLPPGLPTPRLRWSGEVEEWIVLLHEYVDGRDADLSPGSPDVPLVLDTLVVLNEALTPHPGTDRGAAGPRTGLAVRTRGHGHRPGRAVDAVPPVQGMVRPCGRTRFPSAGRRGRASMGAPSLPLNQRIRVSASLSVGNISR